MFSVRNPVEFVLDNFPKTFVKYGGFNVRENTHILLPRLFANLVNDVAKASISCSVANICVFIYLFKFLNCIYSFVEKVKLLWGFLFCCIGLSIVIRIMRMGKLMFYCTMSGKIVLFVVFFFIIVQSVTLAVLITSDNMNSDDCSLSRFLQLRCYRSRSMKSQHQYIHVRMYCMT